MCSFHSSTCFTFIFIIHSNVISCQKDEWPLSRTVLVCFRTNSQATQPYKGDPIYGQFESFSIIQDLQVADLINYVCMFVCFVVANKFHLKIKRYCLILCADLGIAITVESAHLMNSSLQVIENHTESYHINIIPRSFIQESPQSRYGTRTHGITIIMKDNKLTPSLGMNTTWGLCAMKCEEATRDATIIKRLQAIEMVVIAETDLSEWSNLKQALMTARYSMRWVQI